jgi:hypothetical protein
MGDRGAERNEDGVTRARTEKSRIIQKDVRLKGIQGGLETNGPYRKVTRAALIHIK